MSISSSSSSSSSKLIIHRRGGSWVVLMLVATISLICWSSSSSSSSVIVSAQAAVSAEQPSTADDAVDEYDWTCPTKGNCSPICVASGEPCPTYCESLTAVVCNDGSCQDECPSDLINPCQSECAPHICPRAVDYLDVCEAEYATEYEYAETCTALEEANKGQRFNAAAMAFFGFLWLISVLLACCIWGCISRRNTLATKPLDIIDCPGQTVTGYCPNIIGTILYAAIVFTLIGFQVLIFLFVLASYGYFGASRTESLQAFEITWSIGFVFTLLFKWPYSIRSIFLKQCRLHEATQVCVFTLNQAKVEPLPQETSPTAVSNKSSDESYIARMKSIMESITNAFNSYMSLLCCMPLASGDGGRMIYVPVQTADARSGGTRYFVHEFRRYNYNAETDAFEPGQLQVVHTIGDVLNAKPGLTSDQVEYRLKIVGPNVIEMRCPNFFHAVYQEFSKPFYVYQNYMLWTWTPLYYFYLAVIHGSVILVGGFTAAWFTYRNDVNLFKLTHIDGDAECLRDGQFVTVNQSDLVPGDVVTVAPGKVYSDMIMLSSQGLLVDESALTGESTPMAKTAVDPHDANTDYQALLQHKKHTISAGTTVVESEVARNNLAIVLSTGSYTSKGKLLREVFSYQRHEFKFDVEVGFVIAILFLEAIVFFVLVAAFLNEQPTYAWFYGMYIMAALLPPLLPTVFTMSVGVSDNRLSKKNIACSNSEDILVAGKVTKAFFDKTGTLTRQGLDFVSAKCRETWKCDPSTTMVSADLTMGMACCHGLTMSQGGTLIGNPVDRTMFEASGGRHIGGEGGDGNNECVEDRNGNAIDIIKRFDFDHHRMTQSVIVKKSDDTYVAFVKGSGESLEKLCTTESLPRDFSDAVRESAKEATYQITMANKVISANVINSITRDEIEKDLSFVGVINFKNILRPETAGVISHLEEGEVQCIMVTGDSVHTGIRIAKECGLINGRVLLCSSTDPSGGEFMWVDESEAMVELPTISDLKSGAAGCQLAMTGSMWAKLLDQSPAVAMELAPFIRVYGRCSPLHKVSVVNTFVGMGHITAMVGDGGNDCGALKAAHVGVALSDSEASIVSPFTSMDKAIDSVVEILLEGRCALASALASYKYILMYGQIEGIDNLIMAFFRVNLTEYAWAMMDGFWVIGMSFTLPLAKAAKRLAKTRPTSSVLSPITVASFSGVLTFNLLFILIALAVLNKQDWFQCRKWSNEDVSNLMLIGDNYESEVIFLITGYQFISSAMAYNFGYEFRQGWLRNYVFVFLVCLFTFIHFWVTLVPGKLSCMWRVNCSNEDVGYSITLGAKVPIQNPWETTVMPVDFRWTLVILMVSNTIANMGWDYFVVNGTRKRIGQKKRGKTVKLSPAKSLEGDIAETV